jgi:hypothetical protein
MIYSIGVNAEAILPKVEKGRYYAAQSLHSSSACSRTVRVAFSCLSGGYALHSESASRRYSIPRNFYLKTVVSQRRKPMARNCRFHSPAELVHCHGIIVCWKLLGRKAELDCSKASLWSVHSQLRMRQEWKSQLKRPSRQPRVGG